MGFRWVDDALAPKGAVVFEYYGKNPFSVYAGMGGVLQTIFHIRGLNVFEDDFRWDITEDPRPFFVMTHIDKGFDNISEGKVQIKLFGAQPTDPNKDGKLQVEISSWITTEFFSRLGSMTALERLVLEPFVWIYSHVFYFKLRRQYIRFLQDGVEQLEKYFRDRLGIEMRERLTPLPGEIV